MLLAIGDLLEELLVRLRADPVRGSDNSVRSARVRGGSAANVAALDAEMGGTPRFVGQCGDDAIGHVLVEDLRGRGVEADVLHRGATGMVITTVGQGVRTRLVDRGASRGPASLHHVDLAEVSQIYLAAAAFTEEPLASAVETLLAAARDWKLPVVVGGPSSADLEALGADEFLELVRTLQPDAVVLNREEHHALGSSRREPLPGAALPARGRPSASMMPCLTTHLARRQQLACRRSQRRPRPWLRFRRLLRWRRSRPSGRWRSVLRCR